MSNKLLQQCNGTGCGALNINGDPTWVRVMGAWHGAPILPDSSVPATTTLKPTQVRPVTIDLCPACATKTTIAELVALTTPPKPAAPVTAAPTAPAAVAEQAKA